MKTKTEIFSSECIEDLIKLSIFTDQLEENGFKYETQVYFGNSDYKLIIKIIKI